MLATTRLHDLGPALATYLPALAQTLVVPPVLLLVLAWTDLLSAVLVAVTLPLVPVFMVLVGKYTQDATADSARALDRIAAHVAELVRGLPVLVGLGRAAEQAAALARLGEAHRTRTLATLRIAFLSALVLELIATLSVALVAVTVGLRLVHGDWPGRRAHRAAARAGGVRTAARARRGAPRRGGRRARRRRGARGARRPRADRAGRRPTTTTRAVPTSPSRGLTVRYPGRAVAGAAPGRPRRPAGRARGAARGQRIGQVDAARRAGRPARPGRGGRRRGHRGSRARVAYVPQFPRTTGATVADELRRHAGSEPGTDEVVGEAYVVEALGRVGATDLAGRAPESLSPGELQRVALARALVRIRRGARLLLLDEPTAHLDDDARALVADVLLGLRGTVTTLLVTHDPLLAALADRTVDLPSPAADCRCRSRLPAGPSAPEPAARTGRRWRRPAPVRGALARAVLAGALLLGRRASRSPRSPAG